MDKHQLECGIDFIAMIEKIHNNKDDIQRCMRILEDAMVFGAELVATDANREQILFLKSHYGTKRTE